MLAMKLGTAFLCLCLASAARAQNSSTTRTIADVKRLYVPVKPDPGWNDPLWSDPQTVQFQEQLFRSLVVWKKLPQDDPRRKLPKNDPRRTEWGYEGDCEQGITSIISEVKLVCSRKDADAVLLGNVGGSSHDVTSTTTQSSADDSSGSIHTTGAATSTTRQVYQFTGTATL